MISSVINKSLSFFILFAISSIAHAEKKEADQAIPPQEILDACRDKSPNDPCAYEDDKSRKIKGTCLKDTRAVLCIEDPEPAKKE